jgi:hypothetical protein
MNDGKLKDGQHKVKHAIAQPELANLLNSSTTRSTDFKNMNTDSSEEDLQEIKEFISSVGNQASSTSSISYKG